MAINSAQKHFFQKIEKTIFRYSPEECYAKAGKF